MHPRQAGKSVAFRNILLAQPLGDTLQDVPFFDQNSAFAADTFTTAGGIDVHPCLEGGTYEALTRGDNDLPVVRQKCNFARIHWGFHNSIRKLSPCAANLSPKKRNL